MAVESSALRVGGVDVDRAAASDKAAEYLSGAGSYGYPAYDAFDGGAGAWRLSDGDLLAPSLLNVTVRIPAFYALSAVKPRLEAWLAEVPPDARLAEAAPEDLDRLRKLFAVIDDGLPGVGGTTLAKIMHRKRPAFIPLYDRYVWRCYVGVENAPVPRAPHRTWQEFVPLLAAAMQDDLNRENDWLSRVAALAAGPAPVTTLRVLDVVAWQAGRALHVVDEPAEPELQDPSIG